MELSAVSQFIQYSNVKFSVNFNSSSHSYFCWLWKRKQNINGLSRYFIIICCYYFPIVVAELQEIHLMYCIYLIQYKTLIWSFYFLFFRGFSGSRKKRSKYIKLDSKLKLDINQFKYIVEPNIFLACPRAKNRHLYPACQVLCPVLYKTTSFWF